MTKRKKTGDKQKGLFGKSGASRPGYLVLNAKAVRHILSRGVICVPGAEDSFAAEHDLVGKGRRVLAEADLENPLTVVSPKDGCVAEVSRELVGPDVEILAKPLPATGITKLIFATQGEADDWSGRSQNFSGLGPLPETEAREGLRFEPPAPPEEDESDSQSHAPASDTAEAGQPSDPGHQPEHPAPSEEPEVPEPTDLPASSGEEPEINEADHLAGGLLTLFETGFEGFEWMQGLASENMLNRATLARAIAAALEGDSEQVEARVGRVLSILQEPEWNRDTGLLDAQALLSRFADVLSGDDADSEYAGKVAKWSDYVCEILNGTADARADGLLDEGDILLRALQLMVRTKPMYVLDIDTQIDVRGPDLGKKVSAIARILAGWYQGFGGLPGAPKEDPFYSVGCRIAAGLADYPVQLQVLTEDVGDYDTRYVLTAGDVALRGVRVSPSDLIAEVFDNARNATKEAGWELRYIREDSSLQFVRRLEKVVGTIIESGKSVRIRLVNEFELRRKSARGWLKGFPEKLMKLPADTDFRSTPSFPDPKGYPKMSIHIDKEWRGRQDGDENGDWDLVPDYLECLGEEEKKIRDMHDQMVKKPKSSS